MITIPAQLTKSLVQRCLGPSFMRGTIYFTEGRVQLADVDERHAEGLVRGSVSEPYRTKVALGVEQGRYVVHGSCTCPMHRDCKHVAALALAWIDAARAKPPLEPYLRDADEPVDLPERANPWTHWTPTASADEPLDAPVARRRGDAETLLFVCRIDPARGELLVRPGLYRTLKNGQFGKERPAAFDDYTTLRDVRGLPAADLSVALALKTDHGRYVDGARWAVIDDPEDVLPGMLASGRARLGTANGPVVREGEPRALRVAWDADPEGTQLLHAHVDRGVVFGTQWSRYLDADAATIGRTEAGALAPHLATLHDLPALRPEHRDAARAALAAHGLDEVVPAPAPIGADVRRAARLRARVTLYRPAHWVHVAEAIAMGCMAHLEFCYEDACVRGDDVASTVRRRRGDSVTIFGREPEFERTAARFLGREGFRSAEHLPPGQSSLQSYDWLRSASLGSDGVGEWLRGFVERAKPYAIDVATHPSFPVFLGERIDAPELALEDTGGDWFEAKLGVVIDGQRVDLLPILLAALADPAASTLQGLHVKLPDGRHALVPKERLAAILALIADLEQRGESVGVPRAKVPAIVPPPDWRFLPGAKARAFLAELEGFAGLEPIEASPDFRAALRPYQTIGLAWLDFLRRFRFGGVLADDMGLGKTVQVLAHLARERAVGRLENPALVVCPTSVAPNWLAEAQRFAPQLRVALLSRGDRTAELAALATRDVVVTSYALLLRDIDALAAQDWSLVVFDEAQWLKNRTSQGYKAALRLQAPLRVCLTGTPVENHLGELKSQFDLVFPGLLGDDKTFASRFRHPIEKLRDSSAAQSLRKRLRPFLLRRTKAEVATELPPRTTIAQTIELDAVQRDLYETLRIQMEKRVRDALAERGLARSHITVLDALLKLRQVCCDPRLVDLPKARETESSAKREALMDLLPTLIEDGRSILLFSQFTSMLDLIEQDLEARQQPFVRLDGSTRDRAKPVAQFQAGDVPLFLISLKAGGVGLNLTRADTVILYDPWWNPAVEAQAIDRAHRIGQDKPVFVYELLCAGTVEEKMQALKARKRSIADAVLSGEDQAIANLDADELLSLFAAE